MTKKLTQLTIEYPVLDAKKPSIKTSSLPGWNGDKKQETKCMTETDSLSILSGVSRRNSYGNPVIKVKNDHEN